jgi:tRNA nucleotidyltransferase (CCA-adding enzyme)
VVEHERFATAKARLGEHEIDLATARTERYPRPGALPEVEPAAGIEEDLARRDFTVNAMAVPLSGEPRPIDPHGGRVDLDARLLRVLHPRSFADDPTRALRAARYASRLGFQLAPETEALLRETDLSTVSAERRDAELLRLAGEANAPRGFELLGEWGLVELRQGAFELASGVGELLARPPWRGLVPRERAVFAAALGPAGGEEGLAAAKPARPSEAVRLARAHDPVELTLARALGGEWLDRFVAEWDAVRLEIDGGDLIAAGVEQGPALGRGLATALRRKLDGEIGGREEELAAALEAVRGGDG